MPASTLHTAGLGARPDIKLADALAERFDHKHAKVYTSRLIGALPRVVRPQRKKAAWRSALVGPARYPHGNRDAVILAKGRLLAAVVRQRHRDGNLHGDAAAEIDRAREAGTPADRASRPLIPSMLVDGVWLQNAARSHDIPLAPTLSKTLLRMLRPASAAVKEAFRKTLDPEVAKLLRDDDALVRFHDWLADEALAVDVRARRRAAFAEIGEGCGLLRDHPGFEARLDASEPAMSLLTELLDAAPPALEILLKREPAAFRSLEDARRKAWALELLDAEKLEALNDDLAVAGGWAGRLMSFAAVATEDRAERRDIVSWILKHGKMRRFEPHHRSFGEWTFEEGRAEFAELMAVVIKYGMLPEVMVKAEEAKHPVPTAAEIEKSAPVVAREIALRVGIMRIEQARRRWQRMKPWMPKNVAAACHAYRKAWPPLIDIFRTDRAKIECLASSEALAATVGKLKEPAILYGVVAEGKHVLRLSDAGGAIAALTIVTQAELEAAVANGQVSAEHINREGWSATAQWKRWMRVEIGRLVDAVAKGKVSCSLAKLRRALDKRAAAMRAIEAQPCGFDHRHAEARELAKQEIKPILRLVLPDIDPVVERLFGAPPTAEELDLRAWVDGKPWPDPPPKPRRRAVRKLEISPLLRPPSTETPGTSRRKVVRLAPAQLVGGADSLNDYRVDPSGVALPKDISKTRLLVADVETTGVSDEDRIVEIAIIELVGTRETGSLFHSYVNPGIPIPEDATKVHGITDEMVRGSPPFADIADRAAAFLDGVYWFVAHSAEFDLGFINRALVAAGRRALIRADRAICTMLMAEARLGVRSLNDACDKLGIDRRHRVKHGALVDARLCAEAFRKLIPRRRAPDHLAGL